MSDELPPSPGRIPFGLYQLRPTLPVWPPFPPQTDALSAPSAGDLAPVLYDLLPQGAAWRSPDGAAFEAASRMGAFLRALAGDMATLYRRIFDLTQESTASTVAESLDDWEAEFGLPDPCFGDDQTVAQRMRALVMKVRSQGTITPGDFIMLAAGAGYEITIREPRPFAFGFSQTGWEDSTGEAVAFFWFVRVSGAGARNFEFGTSQTGIHSLLDIARVTDLECLFRALAPAWTRPVFDYS
jgi:uncharacterized protein YmfQ (DUF2313 family)